MKADMKATIFFSVFLYMACVSVAGFWQYPFQEKYEYLVDRSWKGINWYDARVECMSEGGDLVTIESEEEYKHIGEIYDSSSSHFWIGLNKLTGEWSWSDQRGSELQLDLMWSEEYPEPDELCAKKVSMRAGNGTFFSDNCGAPHGYICKRYIGKSSPVTPATTENIAGYCPTGYKSAGNNRCYKFVALSNEDGLSWTDARTACKKSDYPSADLACITSEQELAMVTAMIGAYDIHNHFYIGFFKERLEWFWSDNSPTGLTYWAKGVDDSGYYSSCGFVSNGHDPPGSWDLTTSCEEKKGYVCQVLKDPSRVISTPPATSPSTCSEGFSPYLEGCYKLSTVPLSSWEEARSLCHQEQAELADIHDIMENTALKFSLLSSKLNKAWTGLRFIKDKGEFRWTTGWYVNYVEWGPDEPGNDEEGGCVALHHDGKWYSTDCDDKLPVLCKTTTAPPVTHPPDMPGRCPNKDWEDIGGHCYRFYKRNEEQGKWMDQEARCYQFHHKAKLASIHNDVVNDIILRRVQGYSGMYTDVWTGLHRKDENSAWVWSDGTPFQYERFAEGEPDKDPNKGCVYLEPSNGRWYSGQCNYKKAYLCKMDKVLPPSQPPMEDGRCPGPEWMKSGMMCYLSHPDDLKTWFSALEYCEEAGGQGASLASICSITENDIIHHAMFNVTRQPAEKQFWIGYLREGPESPFIWSDGSNSTFHLWGTDEPSEDIGAGHCTAVRMDTNFWYSQHCDQPLGYVCKVPAEKFENGARQFTASIPMVLLGGLLIIGLMR